ncbi:MAG: DUF802 domain-containing protein [Luteimonas sp.]|nr:DUF802 domain-containing protein [Luteimonas sp.]
MRKPLPFVLVFVAGLALVAWIAAGYLQGNPLALAVTLLIGGGYLAGAFELHRYRRATATLDAALSHADDAASLDDWLSCVDDGLRNAVRLRIEGERIALPAPALAPQLVGVLVLLGMLGTLLGMMTMLRGTGLALETATDLQAIRDSLAEPVKGLGFAFGTSIAGIAASAALGLLSALSRRERAHSVQRLDAHASGRLRTHSQAHQREETLRLLRLQTELMPTLVDRLEAMVAGIERQAAATGERQLAQQEAFHARTETTYRQLATSVEASLRDSVSEGARVAGAALQPVMETTMAGIARQAEVLHAGIGEAMQQQLREISTRLETATDGIAGIWQQALAQQQASQDAIVVRHEQALSSAAAGFERHASTLLAGVDQSHAELQATLAAQDAQRLAAWNDALAATNAALREEWQRTGVDAAAQQQRICDTWTRTAHDISAQSQAHARDTIAEISRLMQAASDAPKAAAEVVAELRQRLSDSMARDTAMLEERTQLVATLGTLLDAVNHASAEQRGAIDALVSTSADLLDRIGTRFTDHVEAETGKLVGVADQVSVGAIEVASLGEAFGHAVEQFGQSGDRLAERLERIETTLEKTLLRSDEQLAYYVAQAREVVDLSLLAQKQVFDELQALSATRDAGESATA